MNVTGAFTYLFSSYSNTLIISPFPFYYLAKQKEEDTNMKEKEDDTMKEETTLLFFLFLQCFSTSCSIGLFIS